MQTFLFIGGIHDGLNIPVQSDLDPVQFPAGIAGKAVYVRDTLAVGDVFITIYRSESLTREVAIDRIVKHYKAWAARQRN